MQKNICKTYTQPPSGGGCVSNNNNVHISVHYWVITFLKVVNYNYRIYVLTLHASVTRGNNFKSVSQHCKYDLRKYYFTNRVVPLWNSLPNDMMMADNINLF